MASRLPSTMIDPAGALPVPDSPSIGELLAFEQLLAELFAGFVNLARVQRRRSDHRCAPAHRPSPRRRAMQPRPFRRRQRTLRYPLLERRRRARGGASPHLERFSLAPAAHSGRRPGRGRATRRPAARSCRRPRDLATRRGQVQSHLAHDRRRSNRRGDRPCLVPARAPMVRAPRFPGSASLRTSSAALSRTNARRSRSTRR